MVVGAALRLCHLLRLRATPFFQNLDTDSAVYDGWAEKIASGDWLGHASFFQDPLYPYFLAIQYRILGRNLLSVRLIQVGLSLLAIYLTFRITRLLFGDYAGWFAATVCAVYKSFIFYDVEIEKTVLGYGLVTVFLAFYFCPRKSTQFFAGVTLGLACLVRGNLLIWVPLAAALANFNPVDGTNSFRPKLSIRLLRSMALLGGVLVILGPVMLRNRWVCKEWVVTTTQSGQNFYIGNSPYNRVGTGVFPPFIRGSPLLEKEDFKMVAESRSDHPLSDVEVSRFWWKQSFAHARAHPRFFVGMIIRKIGLFFNDLEPSDNQSMDFMSLNSWVLRLPLITFVGMLVLGVIGVVTNFKNRQVLTLSLFFGAYAVSVAAFYVLSRYRAPSMPVMAILSGGAFSGTFDLWRRKRFLHLSLTAAAALCAFFIAHVKFPELDSGDFNAHGYMKMAKVYEKEHDPDRQRWAYQRTLEWEPKNLTALYEIAQLEFAGGRHSSAAMYLKRLLELSPLDFEGRQLSKRLSDLGQPPLRLPP